MIKKLSALLVLVAVAMNAFSVEVTQAKARSTFALAKTGAVYLTLSNPSDADVSLMSVSVTDKVAQEAQIHTTVMADDMLRMQELKGGLVIASGSTLEMAPGKEHIMLLGLTGPLEKGQTVTLTLHFSDDTNQEVTANIVDMKDGGHHHHHH